MFFFLFAGADAAAPGQSFYQKLITRVIWGLILGIGFLLLMVFPGAHTLTAIVMLLGQVHSPRAARYYRYQEIIVLV